MSKALSRRGCRTNFVGSPNRFDHSCTSTWEVSSASPPEAFWACSRRSYSSGSLIRSSLTSRLGCSCLSVVLLFVGYQGRMALSSLGNYLMLSAAQTTGLSLRMHLLRHLDTLSADYYEDTPVGKVMYPLKEPIDEISYFGSDLLPAILRVLLTTCFTVATMFTLSPALTWAILPLVPTFLMVRAALSAKAHSGLRLRARRPARMESIPGRASLFGDSDTTFGSAKAARANGLSAFGSVGPITTKVVQKQRLVHRGQFVRQLFCPCVP